MYSRVVILLWILLPGCSPEDPPLVPESELNEVTLPTGPDFARDPDPPGDPDDGDSGSGIWFTPEELRQLPVGGPAWVQLREVAGSGVRRSELTTRDDHNVRVMALALVAARLDDDRMRRQVRDALMALVAQPVETDDGLAVARKLGAYAISADLIDLARFDAVADASFRAWLREIRRTRFEGGGGGTLAEYHSRRPNNYGTMAGASRMAVALYLGDETDFEHALQVFRGWLGDRGAYAEFRFGEDRSWHLDPTRPAGINPAGAEKRGRSIDGVLPDDQRRCGPFSREPWPCSTDYAWGALQGAVAMAWIAHRRGHPAFEWEDRALLRAMRWLYDVAGYPPEGDDAWSVHVVNAVVGSRLEVEPVVRPGKNVGWTDWTHVSR
jgi:hypothetical protein